MPCCELESYYLRFDPSQGLQRKEGSRRSLCGWVLDTYSMVNALLSLIMSSQE